MRDQRAGESESLGSQVKWVGFHSRAPGSRQGTESTEAEAGMSDCPLPASLKPAPSLQGTRGTWGALMQGMGVKGGGSVHQHPVEVEGRM